MSICLSVCVCVECVSAHVCVCMCVCECVWHNLNERMTFITMHSQLSTSVGSLYRSPSFPSTALLACLFLSLLHTPLLSHSLPFASSITSPTDKVPFLLRSKNAPFCSCQGRAMPREGGCRGVLSKVEPNLTNSCCYKSISSLPPLLTEHWAITNSHTLTQRGKSWTCNTMLRRPNFVGQVPRDVQLPRAAANGHWVHWARDYDCWLIDDKPELCSTPGVYTMCAIGLWFAEGKREGSLNCGQPKEWLQLLLGLCVGA